uniref:Uncharacterized protein n=1 Tax=Anopheles atroparvus TaxID=41427 RepID=A0AAG5D9W6_ANOAO
MAVRVRFLHSEMKKVHSTRGSNQLFHCILDDNIVHLSLFNIRPSRLQPLRPLRRDRSNPYCSHSLKHSCLTLALVIARTVDVEQNWRYFAESDQFGREHCSRRSVSLSSSRHSSAVILVSCYFIPRTRDLPSLASLRSRVPCRTFLRIHLIYRGPRLPLPLTNPGGLLHLIVAFL